MGRLLRPAVFTRNSSTWKMLKIDLKKEENLISSDNLHVGVRATRAFNKCTTTQAPQVRKLKQNARKFFIHLAEKLKGRPPLQIYASHMSFTKPDSFFQRRIFA